MRVPSHGQHLLGYSSVLRQALCCPWHPSSRHCHTNPFTLVSSITTVGRAESFGLVQMHVMPCVEKGAMDRHRIGLGTETSSQDVPVRARASGRHFPACGCRMRRPCYVSSLATGELPATHCGAVAEWSKAYAWKAYIRAQTRIEGSNPSRSASPLSSHSDRWLLLKRVGLEVNLPPLLAEARVGRSGPERRALTSSPLNGPHRQER